MWTIRNFYASHDYQSIVWYPVRRWLLVEQFCLFGMIVSGALFLMLAATMKTQSFWNYNKPKFRVLKDRIVKDVWS